MNVTKSPPIASADGVVPGYLNFADRGSDLVSAANSNEAGTSYSPEMLRFIRAFNSIEDRLVRLAVLQIVETTAGIKHDPTPPT